MLSRPEENHPYCTMASTMEQKIEEKLQHLMKFLGPKDITKCNDIILASLVRMSLGNVYAFATEEGNNSAFRRSSRPMKGHWYHFDGSKWTVDTDDGGTPTKLLSDIRTKVPEILGSMMTRDPNTARNPNARLYNRLLESIIAKLKAAKPRSHFMMSLRHDYWDKDFMDRLDENDDLICFKNGVYDLSQGTFRPAKPEDMVSLCVGYDYVPTSTDDDEPTTKALEDQRYVSEFFAAVWPDETQRAAMLRAFSLVPQIGSAGGRWKLHVHVGRHTHVPWIFFKALKHVLGDCMCIFPETVSTALVVAGTGMKQTATKRRNMMQARWLMHRWKGCKVAVGTASEPFFVEKLDGHAVKKFACGHGITYWKTPSDEARTYYPKWSMHVVHMPLIPGAFEPPARITDDQRLRCYLKCVTYDDDPPAFCNGTTTFLEEFVRRISTDDHTNSKLKMAFMRVLLLRNPEQMTP
jgi:D5 N terminal like